MQEIQATFHLESGCAEVQFRAFGTYIQGLRGARDRFGVPTEPDDEDIIEMTGLEMNGTPVEIEDVCHLFDMTYKEFENRCYEELVNNADEFICEF